MKLEIIIAGITLFFIANAYYDGKIVHKMKSFKKYYKIAFLAFVGFNIFTHLGTITEKITEILKPFTKLSANLFGDTTKSTIKHGATGTKKIIDIIYNGKK